MNFYKSHKNSRIYQNEIDEDEDDTTCKISSIEQRKKENRNFKLVLFHTTQNVTQYKCDQPFQQSEKLYTNQNICYVCYLRSYIVPSIYYLQSTNKLDYLL